MILKINIKLQVTDNKIMYKKIRAITVINLLSQHFSFLRFDEIDEEMIKTCPYNQNCYRKNLMHFYQNDHDSEKLLAAFHNGIVGVYENIDLFDVFSVHDLRCLFLEEDFYV